MGPVEIIALIKGVFAFPKDVLNLVRFLSKAPEEQKQDMSKRLAEEAARFEETGRPTWG